jgi:hypothetical protein
MSPLTSGLKNKPYKKPAWRRQQAQLLVFLISGVGLRVLQPLTGLLYQPRIIGDCDCGEIGGMKIGWGNQSTRRKPAPAPFCPPQTQHDGRAIAQARLVAGFPPRRPGFKPGSGHVGFCDGQKWHWGRFSQRRTSVSPTNLHSICFSTIIFTITRGWHNRPGVAAVPIASQTRIKIKPT